MVHKNRTPVIFSIDFNKYWSISTIVRTLNMQWVSDVHMCNLRVLMTQGTSLGKFCSKQLIQFALVSDSSCARRFFAHTWRCKASRIIRTTDKRWIPVFWQSITMLDESGERLPGSDQGRWRRWCMLLYKKFSVFRYRTSEQLYIVLSNV